MTCPINALTAGVAALAINSTAFTIEIFRGGFAAVPTAPHEAAQALGLRPALIMALVVVPQVSRVVLPTLGNQIVSVVLRPRPRRIGLISLAVLIATVASYEVFGGHVRR